MFTDTITLDQALQMQSKGDITIVDCSPESIAPYGDQGVQWRNNLVLLQKKHRHVPITNLLSFLNAKYTIEICEGVTDSETNTVTWRYVHGIPNSSIKARDTDNTEYVYVLTNPGYPSLIKIGMTVRDVNRRVDGINATATVDEWQAKFALPVSKGNALKVEQAVHKAFAKHRVSSDKGGSREFFTVNPLTAFDKIREVGAIFAVGDPIIY